MKKKLIWLIAIVIVVFISMAVSTIEQDKSSIIGDITGIIAKPFQKLFVGIDNVIEYGFDYFRDMNELKKINEKNVLEACDTLAVDIIDKLSKLFGYNLVDFIEETKIINPFENNCFKYKSHIMDSTLFRVINHKNEKYVKGLYVIDGLDSDLFAYASSLFAGFNSLNFFVEEDDLNE